MKFHNKRVLITQNSLNSLAGSEITVLELATYLIREGADVTVYTLSIGRPISEEFDKLPEITIVSDINTPLSFQQFDLIWVHHQILPITMLAELAKGVDLPPIVFHHMSTIVPLETPHINKLENYIASVATFNSPGTEEKAAKYYQEDQELLTCVYANPVPAEYATQSAKRKPNSNPQKILIVSNHQTPEIAEAAKLLVEQGLHVTRVGQHHQPILVTPELVSSHDVVISIGKTVQYCLVLGVPIYCYDHFGGPGYLTSSSYELAQKKNFSGKGFERKTGKEIASEIVQNYQEANTFIASNKTNALEKFGIPQNLQKCLSGIKSRGYVKLPAHEVEAFISSQQLLNQYINAAIVLTHKIMHLELQLAEANREVAKTSE